MNSKIVHEELCEAIIDDDLDRAKEIIHDCCGMLPRYDQSKYGTPSYHDWTHFAAMHNAVRVLELLIDECGFSGLERDCDGNLPAHHAADCDSVEAYQWLGDNITFAYDFNEFSVFPFDNFSPEGHKNAGQLFSSFSIFGDNYNSEDDDDDDDND